tara:strand:- start:3222 stop:3491 length:270 start_codon:yes stop_codon:yes gene_type:complete
VAGHGSVSFVVRNLRTDQEHELEFSGVLHVPSLQENILSVAVMDQKGLQLTTGNKKIIIRHDGEFIASAHLSPNKLQYTLSYTDAKNDA